MNKLRVVNVLTEITTAHSPKFQTWTRMRLYQVKQGMYFTLNEGDDYKAVYAPDGSTLFRAAADGYIDANGVGTIQVED